MSWSSARSSRSAAGWRRADRDDSRIGSIRGDDTHLLYMPYAGTGEYAGLRYVDFGVFDEPSGEFTSDTLTAHAGWIEPVE